MISLDIFRTGIILFFMHILRLYIVTVYIFISMNSSVYEEQCLQEIWTDKQVIPIYIPPSPPKQTKKTKNFVAGRTSYCIVTV